MNNHSDFIDSLKGVKIHAIAPASRTTKELMSKLVAIKDIDIQISKHCFDRPTIFHSASDEVRFECLKDAILDDSARIIWAIRGGYGAAKLIPELKKLPKPLKKKILIGYSDITALHLFLTQEWGWSTVHGACLIEMFKDDKDPANFAKLAQIITGQVMKPKIQGLVPLNSFAQGAKTVTGRITGGNLTLVENSIGTEWQIKTDNKIVFLEDIDMKAYQIDRSLLHLKQASLLGDVRAIVFGDFTGNSKEILDTLESFAKSMDIPVFKTNRFGHGKINDPIIYNANCEIVKSSAKSFNLVMTNLLK